MSGEAPLVPGLTTKGALAGRYRVEERLGAGRCGIVVAARHVYLRRRVRLKVLTGASAADKPLAVAQKAAALVGPHVAKIVDTGFAEDGTPFIATERLEGRTLRDELDARGALPPAQATRWIREACAGLAEAHAAGIVHGDLKPENLFLAGGVLKILDFGMPGPGDGEGLWFAAPAYLAPEQVSGAPVDARADVWGLGVTLHELIAGALPFRGETVSAMLVAAATEEPAPLLNVPPGLAAIVKACLAKDPAERPDVSAVARALLPFATARAASSGRSDVDSDSDSAPDADSDSDSNSDPDANLPALGPAPVTLPGPLVAARELPTFRDDEALVQQRRVALGVGALIGAALVFAAAVALGAGRSNEPIADDDVASVYTEAVVPRPFVPHSFMLEQPDSAPPPRRTMAVRDDGGFTHPARLR